MEKRARHNAAHAWRLFAIAAALGIGSCAAKAPPAAYGHDECRRVALLDGATGAVITGAEDVALDAARGRLFLSAYDRRAARRAIRRKAAEIPEGGVYVVQLGALRDAETRIEATPLVRAGETSGGLRPHGLTYDGQTDEVVFINRGYQKIDGRWRLNARLQRIGSNGAVIVGPDVATRCAANDVIHDAEGIVVSFDHEKCGWRALFEDALTLRRSGVALASGPALFDAAAHANGLVPIGNAGIALAATREKALLLLERTPSGYAERLRIPAPGGPDNLSVGTDGAIVAAVHPSLARYALSLRMGFGTAPSRVVKFEGDGAMTETLFDDPSGRVFSGATVAVEKDGLLILGSATDSGLLVCRKT